MMNMSTSPPDISMLVEDLQQIFGARLTSVVTYGIQTARAVAGGQWPCQAWWLSSGGQPTTSRGPTSTTGSVVRSDAITATW
jgi:hypothetical protein